MEYKELCKSLKKATAMGSWNTLADLEHKACTAIKELMARAEAAEARCETLEKMVKEYQDTIVPGYRERAEKAEAERDAAVSDMEALMCNCVDGCHVCANAIVVQIEPCVRLDCELKGRKCNPKWRGAKEE